jgi:hypothetical protein
LARSLGLGKGSGLRPGWPPGQVVRGTDAAPNPAAGTASVFPIGVLHRRRADRLEQPWIFDPRLLSAETDDLYPKVPFITVVQHRVDAWEGVGDPTFLHAAGVALADVGKQFVLDGRVPDVFSSSCCRNRRLDGSRIQTGKRSRRRDRRVIWSSVFRTPEIFGRTEARKMWVCVPAMSRCVSRVTAA